MRGVSHKKLNKFFTREVTPSVMTLKREIGSVLHSAEQYSSHYFSFLLLHVSIKHLVSEILLLVQKYSSALFLDVISLVKFIILSIFVMVLNILIKAVLKFVSDNSKILTTGGLFLLAIFFSWFLIIYFCLCHDW